MDTLTLRSLSKRFADVRAVERFSLKIRAGELLALVGPSGCGKTTVLRLVAGFAAPDGGDILLAGASALKTPPERRGVGVVFQHYALFPHLSVSGNVAYGLRFVKPPVSRQARVAELLELVGLSGLERRRPDELSAGQRQRVALARALAPRPRVLLLDEPLSALDVQLRERLRGEIRAILKGSGTTALYITHDQEEALAIADRVAVMRAGQLEQVDTPQRVYHRPQTPFVADFVGRGNLFAAKVVAVEPPALRVRSAGAEWTIVAEARPRPGSAVRVLVRPERLALGDAGPNRLRATVASHEFLGPQLRLHLRRGEQRITALCPGTVAAEALPLHRPVDLSFAPEDGWVLPSDAADGAS